DKNVISSDSLSVDFNRACINEAPEARENIHPVPVQTRFVRGVNTRDIRAAVLYQRGPVETMDRSIEAIVGTIVMDSLSNMRGIPHDFLGNTTHIDTGAAEVFRFDQGTFFSVHGGAIDRRNTAAAAANGNVVVVFHWKS